MNVKKYSNNLPGAKPSLKFLQRKHKRPIKGKINMIYVFNS
jgi:hypothetical protein